MDDKTIEEKIKVMKTLLNIKNDNTPYFSIDWIIKTLGLEKDINIGRKDKIDKIRNIK